MAAFRGIFRAQEEEFDLVLDEAAAIARRLGEIDDAAVERALGIELAFRRADDALVSADITETRAVREVLDAIDGYGGDLGVRWRRQRGSKR